MIDLIAGIGLGIALTCWILWFMIRRAERRAIENVERLLHVLEQLKQGQILARVEEQDGVFYIYNTEDDSFMAQGSTVTELRERIEQRWRDVRVYVTQGEQDVIDRLKATNPDMETDRA